MKTVCLFGDGKENGLLPSDQSESCQHGSVLISAWTLGEPASLIAQTRDREALEPMWYLDSAFSERNHSNYVTLADLPKNIFAFFVLSASI